MKTEKQFRIGKEFVAIIDTVTEPEECGICAMGTSDDIPNWIRYYRYKDHITHPKDVSEGFLDIETLLECPKCGFGSHNTKRFRIFPERHSGNYADCKCGSGQEQKYEMVTYDGKYMTFCCAACLDKELETKHCHGVR